jgi:hypothetical protein
MAKAARKTITTKKTGTAPDPILKLIADANKSLADLRRANDELAAVSWKIGEDAQNAVVRDPVPFQAPFLRSVVPVAVGDRRHEP